MGSDLAAHLRAASERLRVAAVDSPRHDARMLAADVLGVTLGRVDVLAALGTDLSDQQSAQLEALIAQREQRVPLQLIIGSMEFGGVCIDVEPGVFIPRPESELLVEAALQQLRASRPSTPITAVDLCTGTGAIAAALAHGLADANGEAPVYLHAVEIDPRAYALARKNAADWNVEVHLGDATRPETIADLAPLLGTVDAVVSNPPYVPEELRVTQLEAQLDPELALYGGSPDGTLIPLRIADAAARLLRAGGIFLMEHDETHAEALVATMNRHGMWENIIVHHDLAERPRFLTALRTDRDAPPPEATEVQE